MEFEEEETMVRAKLKEWFCGSNTSNWTSHNSYSHGKFLHDMCLVNFYYSVFHLAFAILLISTQGIAYCQIKQQRRFLLKLPGHNIRWILATLLVFIQIVATAEGILTDSTRTKEDVLSFLYLYVPSICALFAGVCAILQSHYMEVWQNKWLSIVLTTYWTLSCGTEILRFANLLAIDLDSFRIVRFDIVIILSFIYGTLDIIEINSIRTRNYASGQSHSSITRDEDESKQNMLFYRDYVSFPSSILHWWIHWLLRLGYRKPLTLEDLGCLPEAHLASPNYQRLKVALQEEQNIALRTGSKPSLLKVFWKLSWKVMLPYGLLRSFGEPFVLITPFAISGIITYVNALDAPPNPEETFHFITLKEFFTDGFVLVVAIFVANIIERICLWTSQYMLVVESVHIRAGIQAAVYEKSLHLSSLSASKSQTSIGKITNCMSTDAGNVLMAMQMIHFVIIPPLTLATLLLLFNTLGISSVCGLAVCIVLFPVIVITSKQISIFQKKALVFADERVKHIHELLKEMKLLKLNAWEELFCQTIEKLRLKEVHHICHKNLVFAVAAFCSNATPILMTVVSFGTYTLLNEEPLTPEIAFPSLALFSLFDRFLFIIPVGLSSFVTGYVSTKRLESFLLAPCGTDVVSGDGITSTAAMSSGNKEGNCSHLFANSTNHFTPDSDVELKHIATANSTLPKSTSPKSLEQSVPNDTDMQLMKCNLAWDRTDTEPVLKDVDIQIESGKLTMVVGPVGSGKSALLASILEEMFLLSGDIKFPRLKPSMAFAAQRPWIQNATLRDNILCGLPMDKHRYDDVISACALEPDIDLLPAGDLTEIGERGINLSGGQKQRVNVARAIYSQAHIVLLDDPLSALDVYVGSHLFESGIMGLLRRNNRTVVLVTNQLQYLQHADKIIVLDGGVIRHQGSYSQIVERDQQLLTQWSEAVNHTNSLTNHNTSEMERVVLQQEVALKSQYQQHSDQTKTGERSALIVKEDMMRGSVIASVYCYLIQASGWSLVAFVIGFGVVQTFYLGKDFWLAKWSEAGVINPNKTADQMGYFIGGYAGISLATIVVIVASQLVHTLAALTAGITLHKAMLNNVSKLPLRFFDTNPLGRVLNRFSSDMNMIDMKLFRTIDGSTYAMWKIIFCYIAIIIVAPLFSIVAVIVGIVYFFLQRFYIKTSRELQRLESVAKSPIYAHFSETLDGLSTIKAFGFQKRFFDTLLQRIDTHSTTYLYLRTASVWLNLRLDMMGATVVLLAGLSTMLGAVSSSLSPALVALAIVYAQRASGSYGYLVKFLTDLEMHMNAVERIKHYATLPTEEYGGFRKPPVDWPKHGVIQFEDVSIKYANDLDPVLKCINLHFHSAEKVGICGRTGSGKSSLVLALFRCNIICRGHIYIDDINIAELPLTTLRRQLAIIPQDPTLFTGTIRENLDPEGNKPDEELWNALTISQLKSAVTELKGGLDASVSEGGKNFSVGQRQLFCLARAFLHKSRILVMDEATASVDTETAKVLQEMLTSAFVDRTVLTIAHRVNSILESDRILVMSEGSVVEFDTPDNLLADKDSMFASIVLASEGGTLAH